MLLIIIFQQNQNFLFIELVSGLEMACWRVFAKKLKHSVIFLGRCARAGRSGVAFSLVAVEEGPYVLDLHLFLGRPLNLLPTGSETSETYEAMAFGRVPEDSILAQQQEILQWHQNDDFVSIYILLTIFITISSC